MFSLLGDDSCQETGVRERIGHGGGESSVFFTVCDPSQSDHYTQRGRATCLYLSQELFFFKIRLSVFDQPLSFLGVPLASVADRCRLAAFLQGSGGDVLGQPGCCQCS